MFFKPLKPLNETLCVSVGLGISTGAFGGLLKDILGSSTIVCVGTVTFFSSKIGITLGTSEARIFLPLFIIVSISVKIFFLKANHLHRSKLEWHCLNNLILLKLILHANACYELV